ncbi:MAG: alanine racemase, partial [Gammaproteobacteria bacterium]|nr:alanine racemase [Gammaproteobacteria bacterium]
MTQAPSGQQITARAQARIDLSALQHNLQRVKQAAPDSHVMAIIKSNAYGHGALQIARALSEANAFGVAILDEAITLRDNGFSQEIILLSGFVTKEELIAAAHYQLTVVVHNVHQLDVLFATELEQSINVWVKIDTGMHRLGFAPDVLQDVLEKLAGCKHIKRPLRFMTHLANADDQNNPNSEQQIALFNNVLEGIKGEQSIANSGGILGWQESHRDWVRPGIMLYGVSPFNNQTGLEQDLQPVMTLSARLIAVNKHKQGDKIGYGSSWECPEDMMVGVVGIGYGDGYPRHAPTDTPVLINGQPVPLVGRVSMDMICVDLRSQPDAKPGDRVILWG